MQSKKQTWYEKVFDSLDFSEVPLAAGLDLKKEPPWAVNALMALVKQVSPAVYIRKGRQNTPRDVGRCAGQMCANIYLIGEILPVLAANAKQCNAIAKALSKHPDLPAVQSALETSKFTARLVQAWVPQLEPFEKTVMDAFKAALDQTSHLEAAEFFQGFAAGISKPGLNSRAAVVAATTATPIYMRLFTERRHIERLQSVRELREFLLQLGLPEQVLGGPERLETLCGRIGLSFRKPGRPKRAN